MATGASTADLAVVLVDARKGVLPQSRRHAHIASLLGIGRMIVAVNKMDLTGYREDVFEAIRREFGEHLDRLGVPHIQYIPISALEGDNVVGHSPRMPWYGGPSLLQHLENVPLDDAADAAPFRFPVQYVLRPDDSFRGYAGQIVSGTVRPGDTVMTLPGRRVTRIRSIPTWDGDLSSAAAPMSVALCLEDEIDLSRGDMLVHTAHAPHVAHRFEAQVVWMHERPLEPGRPYVLKHTTQTVGATVTALRHRVDVNTLDRQAAERLGMNEIGLAVVEASRPLFFDPYRSNRATGSFILIDPLSNATVAAGMIRAALDGSETAVTRVTEAERVARNGHRSAVVWLPGDLEAAWQLEARLFGHGCHVFVVTEAGRFLPELVEALAEAGLIVIVAAEGDRESVETRVGSDRFLAVPPGRVWEDLERRGMIGPSSIYRNGEGI